MKIQRPSFHKKNSNVHGLLFPSCGIYSGYSLAGTSIFVSNFKLNDDNSHIAFSWYLVIMIRVHYWNPQSVKFISDWFSKC